VPRGRALTAQGIVPGVPPGLPSTLLERRPDLRAAEQLLVAENARIGEVQARLYPRIALTGAAGVQSDQLSEIATPEAVFWSLGLNVLQPLFNSGRLDADVREQESRQREAVLNYLRTVRNAFREVSDALVGYGKNQEFRAKQEDLVRVLTDASRLSRMRYDGGVVSYLEVLDTDRQLFDAELALAKARLGELQSVVELYRALGGGWEPEPPQEDQPE
jgi:multidrug efflux system outer membrane protein